jgi:hypothetical protein
VRLLPSVRNLKYRKFGDCPAVASLLGILTCKDVDSESVYNESHLYSNIEPTDQILHTTVFSKGGEWF